MNELKIAVCQVLTELDQDATLEKTGRMVHEAAQNGAQIVALPEMFNCPYSKKYFHTYAAMGHEKTVRAMSSWAKDNGIILVGGSIPETEGDRIYNTCFVYDENGTEIARHRKAHLFDVDIPGMRFSESATFTPGDQITVFDTKYGRMGVAVCFDVRFRGGHVRGEIAAVEGVRVARKKVKYKLPVKTLLLTAGAVIFYILSYHSATAYMSRRRCRNVGRRRRTSSTGPAVMPTGMRIFSPLPCARCARRPA